MDAEVSMIRKSNGKSCVPQKYLRFAELQNGHFRLSPSPSSGPPGAKVDWMMWSKWLELEPEELRACEYLCVLLNESYRKFKSWFLLQITMNWTTNCCFLPMSGHVETWWVARTAFSRHQVHDKVWKAPSTCKLLTFLYAPGTCAYDWGMTRERIEWFETALPGALPWTFQNRRAPIRFGIESNKQVNWELHRS